MVLVFDIGGTHLRVGRSADLETLEGFTKVPTIKSFDKGISQIKEQVDNLAAGQNLESIVLGIAGPLNPEKSILLAAPNLPDWTNKPLKQILEQSFPDTKIYLENDASLAGLGEAHFGAGKGYNLIAYLTIGTGVGGVRIVDGAVDANKLGFEPGHMIVDAGKTLEDLISGTSIKANFGIPPESLRDDKAWHQISRYLAIGLNNIIVEWSPEIIILGGSVTQALDLNLVQNQLKEIFTLLPSIPPIVKSKLGDQSALYGALQYLKSFNS